MKNIEVGFSKERPKYKNKKCKCTKNETNQTNAPQIFECTRVR